MIHQPYSKRVMPLVVATLLVSSTSVDAASTRRPPAFVGHKAPRHLSVASGAVSEIGARSSLPHFEATHGYTWLSAAPASPLVTHPASPSGVISASEILSSESPTPANLARSILQSTNKQGIKWITDVSADSLLNVFTKSFSGSESADPEPLMEWGLRSIVPSKFNQDRCDLYKYVLSMGVEKTLKDNNAFFFGHHATNMGNESGERDDKYSAMASAVLMKVLDPAIEFQKKSRFASAWEEAKAFWKLAKDRITGKLPAPLCKIRNLGTFVSRFPVLMETLETSHATYGPQERHLFVNLVAMDPDFQGQGFGKQLMNQVAELGDELGLPCYLECAGERNPRFYEKFGFRIVGESEFSSNEGEEDGSVYRLFYMTREPQL